MENESKTISSEIISEQENRLKVIISELDSTINDFLEKGKFALIELMELIDEKPSNINAACMFAGKQERVNMFVNIAFDYLHRAQGGLEEIVTMERRKQKEDTF